MKAKGLTQLIIYISQVGKMQPGRVVDKKAESWRANAALRQVIDFGELALMGRRRMLFNGSLHKPVELGSADPLVSLFPNLQTLVKNLLDSFSLQG